jgi:hypothetical protein
MPVYAWSRDQRYLILGGLTPLYHTWFLGVRESMTTYIYIPTRLTHEAAHDIGEAYLCTTPYYIRVACDPSRITYFSYLSIKIDCKAAIR